MQNLLNNLAIPSTEKNTELDLLMLFQNSWGIEILERPENWE